MAEFDSLQPYRQHFAHASYAIHTNQRCLSRTYLDQDFPSLSMVGMTALQGIIPLFSRSAAVEPAGTAEKVQALFKSQDIPCSNFKPLRGG